MSSDSQGSPQVYGEPWRCARLGVWGPILVQGAEQEWRGNLEPNPGIQGWVEVMWVPGPNPTVWGLGGDSMEPNPGVWGLARHHTD